jgi:hypothetical protein
LDSCGPQVVVAFSGGVAQLGSARRFMSTDSNSDAPRKLPPRVIRVVLMTLAWLSLLYVLSEGPMYRLYRKDVISHDTLVALYSPIYHVSKQCSWCDDLEWRYDNLWYDEEYEFMKAVDAGLKKEGIVDVVNNEPTTLSLLDLVDLGFPLVVLGLAILLIFFPHWFFRVLDERLTRGKQNFVRASGFVLLPLGIWLFLIILEDFHWISAETAARFEFALALAACIWLSFKIGRYTKPSV